MCQIRIINKTGQWFSMVLGILLPLTISAQDIRKEVYVISSFRPEVAEANKMSSLPSITDTMSVAEKASYTVLPSHLKTEYKLHPIKPATMTGTPLDKLYNSYLKLGMGNYTTPLAEFSIHNLRSKEYSVGAYAFHKSSHAKLALENGRKVPAGFGRNEITGYGKYFYEKTCLSGEAGLINQSYRFYGINVNDPAIFPDSVEVDVNDLKQQFVNLFLQARVSSNNPDSNATDYSLTMRGEYFEDYFSHKEPYAGIDLMVNQPVKGFDIGLQAGFHHTGLTDTSTINDNIAEISPYLSKNTGEWEIKVAARIFLTSGIEQKTYVFPDASIRFQIVKKVLITRFGVNGYLQDNSYQSITLENPYVLPGLYVRNTQHRFVIYAGLEGQLSSKASYRLNVSADATEDMYFFVNDTVSRFRNRFDVVYDDADVMKYSGEFMWSPFDYFDFFTTAAVYSYSLNAEDKPWHKSLFDLTMTARYNFKNKIYASIDFYSIGERFAKNYDDPENPYKLDPIFDFNLRLEYKYSKVLSLFLDFYNISSQKYQIWNQYPSQQFNVLGGLTYKF